MDNPIIKKVISGMVFINAISNYSKLKNVTLIKPTIHKYLAGQTKSQFRRIDADEFTIATLLPVQRFKKATDRDVWRESRSMI